MQSASRQIVAQKKRESQYRENQTHIFNGFVQIQRDDRLLAGFYSGGDEHESWARFVYSHVLVP